MTNIERAEILQQCANCDGNIDELKLRWAAAGKDISGLDLKQLEIDYGKQLDSLPAEFKTAYWAEKDPLAAYFELQRRGLLNFTIVDCHIDDKTLTRKLYCVGKSGKYRNLGFELSLDLLRDMSEKFGIDPVQEMFSVMNYEGERE